MASCDDSKCSRRSNYLVAVSSAMLGVLGQAERVSAFDVSVLLRGESGTGKELVARAIHDRGHRSGGSFVALNCAAIPDPLLEAELFGHVRGAFTGAERRRAGLLEEAHGGTLFLDEVADLSPRGQTLLLRVLQDKEYRRLGESAVQRSDFRLISATHKCLEDAVKAGRFRQDLYFRLRVVEILLPPLRKRPEDIVPLTRHFLRTKSRQLGLPEPALSSEAEEALRRYPWPGNIRELENEILRALMRGADGEGLTVEHLSGALQRKPGSPFRFASLDFEKRFLKDALARYGGNRTRTAHALGFTRQTLYNKLRRHGLVTPICPTT